MSPPERQCSQTLVHFQHTWWYEPTKTMLKCPGLKQSREWQPVRDRQPRKPEEDICDVCGTWVCTTCYAYHRPYASRHPDAHHICGRCGGDKGYLVAVRHRSNHGHWEVMRY